MLLIEGNIDKHIENFKDIFYLVGTPPPQK